MSDTRIPGQDGFVMACEISPVNHPTSQHSPFIYLECDEANAQVAITRTHARIRLLMRA